MRTFPIVCRVITALALASVVPSSCYGQTSSATLSHGITKICTIQFAKDLRRPARLDDSAQACLTRAVQHLSADPATQIYLVATADSHKDARAANGHSRTEQDMTGEDLRYADVAAYRAINTKAYMVRWLHANPKLVVPLTAYENGQWLEAYQVDKGVDFKSAYDKKTAPIMERPCTTGPCASGYEEFLLAQQRGRIPQ